MNTREAVASRILELCRERGITPNGLSNISAVPQATIKNLSRNKCICGIMPKGDENDRKEELSSMDNFR